MLTNEEKESLKHLREILVDLIPDLQDFQEAWVGSESAFRKLESAVSSKSPTNDGALEIYSLYLAANQVVKGLNNCEQEIGRKLKLLEKGAYNANHHHNCSGLPSDEL